MVPSRMMSRGFATWNRAGSLKDTQGIMWARAHRDHGQHLQPGSAGIGARAGGQLLPANQAREAGKNRAVGPSGPNRTC